LREILTNLIFNSVDAMPNGGTITARTSRAEEHVVLELIDTGTGMTEEVRTRCLEPFFSTKGDNGTGLGLSMVFGVIRRHEGRLDIESRPGMGSTFRIAFPRQVKTFAAAADAASGTARPLRVLVVDDEAVPRDVVTKYLSANGHEVVAVTAGPEALENFRRSAFDLVITDHAMPQMNGTQLAELIKAERPGQPVLMLTGFSDRNLSPDTIPPNVDLMLPKPTSQQELRNAITKLLPA
jgi:CheY-like chemotaxis protein